MITAALVGNPNVGKTSLFNYLTGSNQYVGNWAGVTVEKKEGLLQNSIKIVDLPGIYAMDTFSNEEKIAKNFLIDEQCDVIINIIDASNLVRNLYLTLQLKKFQKPIILVLNMVDVAESKGMKYNYELLSKKLNVTVVPIIALKGKGMDKLISTLVDSNFLSRVVDNEYHMQSEKESYKFLENIYKEVVVTNKAESYTNFTEKIDKIVLNKYLAYPLFFLLLFVIFKFTFNWVGKPLADYLNALLNHNFVPYLQQVLENSSPWFSSLIVDGIVGGIGSILVFLPVILTLFLGISFLEDSGYMARAAFLMDKLMRNMGLSGKAFIPLIVGFGCSVPAIMSARTLESEKDRKLTALLVPLMSCNARLPVFAIFATVFFPGKEAYVVMSLYFLGILLAFLIGILFKNTLFKKDEEPFIIELPEFKAPDLKNLGIHTWEKGKGFLKKAGTIIFAISVIIWFLSNFNTTGKCDIEHSLLAYIGKIITPIFLPLGFATWQNSVALLTGIMAKEIILSSMGVIYGGDLQQLLKNFFTPVSAYAFLTFVLLYTPCVSVIGTMKKEFGTKMAMFSVFYQVALAWIMSFIVYRIGILIF